MRFISFIYSEITAIKECKTPLMSAMQVCLSEKALQDLEVFNSTIDEALDFMCFKGGERIASKLTSILLKV